MPRSKISSRKSPPSDLKDEGLFQSFQAQIPCEAYVRMVRRRGFIITVDGPSGAGKSTLARMLASRLGFRYVDTGSLYRAVGWWVQRQGLDPESEDDLRKACRSISISVHWDQAGCMRVLCSGQDVTEDLRGEAMGMVASRVSAKAVVRQHLWELQRRLAEDGCLVFEGRDMGTQVFPDAPVRFFLTAEPRERARRRYEEMLSLGQMASLEMVLQEMSKRDQQDSSRELAPLKVPQGAIVLDTTDVPPEAVLERMLAEVKARMAGMTGDPADS